MRFEEIPLGKAEDLSQKTFAFLKPLYRTNNIGKHTAWKCECLKCGALVNVRIDHLKEQRVKSCGCYNKEVSAEHLRSINHKGKNAKDITGLQSGYLVAIEPTEKRKRGFQVVWKCQCLNPIHKTPVFCEATTAMLTSKKKKSCGCISSFGEAKVSELLTKYNLPYEREKSFDSCRMNKNGAMYFDFYVNNQYLIEYDGIQHFLSKEGGWNTPDNVKLTQERDAYKNQWCKDNNIPLIRIPYTHLDDLIIEDLILETSNYII